MKHHLLPEVLMPLGKKFLTYQLILWVTYGFIYRMAWYSYEAPPVAWIVSYIGLGFTSSTLLASFVWLARTKPFAAQLLIALLSAIVLGIIWRVTFHIIEWHVIVIYVPDDLRLYSYIHNSMMSVIYLVAWAAGYFLVAYYTKYLHQQERATKAELLAREAEIKLLHLQISPHFLFNVLNSLDTLLLKDDVRGSRDMLAKLSQFLRQTLSEEPSHQITLQEEVERTKSYLDIELVRFGDKLKVVWDIDKSLNSFNVPSLILQPLVENAIKHCVSKSMHGGTIKIEASLTGQAVELAVINKPNGEETDKTHTIDGLGIGLDNIKARLDVQFGNSARVHQGPTKSGGFEVRIMVERNSLEHSE